MAREFQIFSKPVGAACNLRCRYCYYLGKAALYAGAYLKPMEDTTLRNYIIQHIEASDDEVIMFSWHGGEPLLAGIDFFRKVVSLQKELIPPERKYINGIQTNGTLLNDLWCSFLRDEGFIAGISIDGPAELHDTNRRYISSGSSFKDVINGYKLLDTHNIPAEILCVVNSANADYPLEVYNFFRELNAKCITFLPLVEQSPSCASGVSELSVPAEKFGKFLSVIFDEWAENDIGRIRIQIFEEAARTAFNIGHTLCIFKVACGGVPVVERNGDFYSCDHFVDRDHLIGNINESSIAAMLDSPGQVAFGELKLRTLPSYCLDCEVRSMCNGECPKNRFINTPDGEPGLNYLCAGYKIFFNHCRPFLLALKMASEGLTTV